MTKLMLHDAFDVENDDVAEVEVPMMLLLMILLLMLLLLLGLPLDVLFGCNDDDGRILLVSPAWLFEAAGQRRQVEYTHWQYRTHNDFSRG
jgi:hypothetical protein